MYKEPKDMVFVVLSLFSILVIVLCVISLSHKEIQGGLYLNKDGKSDFVCDGVLYNHIGYVTKHDFVCSDGREIYNLTNFTIKKAGE